jgi:hypothetical protein
MIYRRPSLSREQFVLSAVAAGTGAILVGVACGGRVVPSSGAFAEDASENVPPLAPSGTGANRGFVLGSSASSSGGLGSSSGSINGCAGICGKFAAGSFSSSSSGGCESGSGSGCNLIRYDAASDAYEHRDTGSDQEAASDGSRGGSSDGGGDGVGDGAAETGDDVAQTGDP